MFWRLHEAVFGDQVDRAQQLLAAVGDEVQVVSGSPSQLAPVPALKADRPALAITTLQDARKHLAVDGTPWLYFDRTKYDVSYWLPRLDPAISVLNRRGAFLPVGMLLTADAHFLAHAFHASRVFVRPDSGGKPFTGGVISLDHTMALQLRRLLDGVLREPECMCFVAPMQSLTNVEWRFWVADRKIVCSAPYGWDGDIAWCEPPVPALLIAQAYARNAWQPDLCSVVDVVETVDGAFYLNEINAVSTSGVYTAPLHHLLPALRELANREFEGEIAPEC